MPLDIDIYALKAELEEVGHGQKSGIVQRYADGLGVSRATIYRELRKVNAPRFKVERASKYPKSIVDYIARLKIRGARMSLKAREVSTEECVKIAIENRVPGWELLYHDVDGRRVYHVPRINALLRKSGYRVRDPKTRIEARYANESWQIDFTRSKCFQVVGYSAERNDWEIVTSNRELHYKADDHKLRLWLVHVVDEFSRLRHVFGFASTGETGFIGLEALHRIWNTRDDGHLMHYLPDRIRSDSGAWRKSKFNISAMEALGIRLEKSTPGNKDALGKVERGHRMIWQRFEGPLALRLGAGHQFYLSEYNAMLLNHVAMQHKEEHPMRPGLKGDVYLQDIQKNGFREVETDILAIACKVETRVVSDLCEVSWKGVFWGVPQFAQNKVIRVYENMHGDLIGEIIGEFRYPFALIPPTEGFKAPVKFLDDFEHRHHATYKQKMATEVDRQDKAPWKDGNRISMPVAAHKRKKVDPVSVFAEQAQPDDSTFATRYDAQIYIGTQIMHMTNKTKTYQDFAFIFDELLEETLNRTRILDKIEDLRCVLREVNMEVAK